VKIIMPHRTQAGDHRVEGQSSERRRGPI